MLRARLIASQSMRWCAVQTPEIRRGRILPRSGMKFCKSFTSLKSMMSTLSTQKRQTLRRRMRPRAPPRPRCSRPAGILSSSESKSRSRLSKFLDIILFPFPLGRAASTGKLRRGPSNFFNRRRHAQSARPSRLVFAARGCRLRLASATARRGCHRSLRGLARAASLELLGAAAILVNAHGDVAQDLVAHAHAALKLGDLAARALDLEEHIDAFVLPVDRVGELPAAHHFRLDDRAAPVCDDAPKVFRQACGLVFRRVRVNDEDDLVNSLLCQNHPPLGCLASTTTVEARRK